MQCCLWFKRNDANDILKPDTKEQLTIPCFPFSAVIRFWHFRCGVYKSAMFISKIKIEENEMMCQHKTTHF